MESKGDIDTKKCYLPWLKTTIILNFTHILCRFKDIPSLYILHLLYKFLWKMNLRGPCRLECKYMDSKGDIETKKCYGSKPQ